MGVSESARNDLYNGLRDLLGADRAETLMTYLPTFDPSEIATKSDMANLQKRLEERFTAIDNRFVGLERRLDDLGRRVDRVLLTLAAGLFVIFASVLGVLGVVIATIT